MEKSKLQYACLARIVREGGFRVALVARYSAIPGHCEFIDVLVDVSLSITDLDLFSYNCDFFYLWHGHMGVLVGRDFISAKAIHHCLYRRCSRARRRWRRQYVVNTL